jgi:signal transduction histidine kinase
MSALWSSTKDLLRSPGCASTASLFTLFYLLSAPGRLPALVAIAAALWTSWAFFRCRLGRADGVLLGAMTLALAGGTTIGLWRVSLEAHDDDYWEQRVQQRLDDAEAASTDALSELVEQARRRATAALVPDADLESLARPLDFLGRPLEVGVSLWREGKLQDWAGSVTGPQRLPAQSRPLLVDHNFRRYLTISASGDETGICRVDVSMGLRGDFFADVGVWPDPATPLRESTGVDVEVVAVESDAVDDFDRWIGVPETDPWVWVGLRESRVDAERGRASRTVTQVMAWCLLAAMGFGLLRCWRWWPSAASTTQGAAFGIVSVLVLVALRWAAEKSGLAVQLLDDLSHPLSLLRDEAYFTTLRMGGWLRSAADFSLSALTLALAALVLLPSWLRFVAHPASTWRRTLSGGLLVAAAPLLIRAIWALQSVVAQGANPTLVGVRAPFFSLAFLTLHVAMMLTLLPWAVWVLLGWDRWLRERGAYGQMLCLLSCALTFGILWMGGASWTRAGWAALLPLLGWVLQPALREPGLSRRLVVLLFTMLWFAGVQSQGLQDFYTLDRQQVAEERAVGRLRPDDPWRPYLLEDVLRRLSADRVAMARLTDPLHPRDNLAFELWLTTELSRQGSPSCSITVLGSKETVLSRFDFGLPYELPTQHVLGDESLPRSGTLRMGTLEIGTDRGRFLVYRGILDLQNFAPGSDLHQLRIDLPYATLDPASADGDFRGVIESLGLPDARPFLPRQAFENGELVFATVDSVGVVASSSPELLNLSPGEIPGPGRWTAARVGGRTFRVGQVQWGGKGLVVGFTDPTSTERVLDASRLAMLYLLSGGIVFFGLVLLGALGVTPEGRRSQLLGPIGFQERLLGAILLVVLLPVLVLGVVQERRGGETATREGLREVHQRLQTSLNLLSSDLDRMTQALLRGDYVQQLLSTGEISQWRDVGPFGRLELMIFAPDGSVLLDESLRNLDAEGARAFLEDVEGGRLYLESFSNTWFVGRLYHLPGRDGSAYTVFARKQVTDEDLGRLARVVGADLTLFDGPWAVVSSQDYLLEAGLTVPILASAAARAIFDHGGHELVEAEGQGGLVVARGYVGLDGPGDPRRGVLQARLFAQATESAREQQRARLFLLGLSSLALVMAVAVGLLLAGRIVDPIRGLVAATRRVGRGELDLHLPARGGDEIGELLRSFNRMTADLRTSRQELAARRSFLEDMLGTLSVGVLVLDADGQPSESNAAAREVLDQAEEQLLLRVRALGPPTELCEFELVVQAELGPRTLRSVVTPTRLESGEKGWLVLVDDVTELLASRRLSLYAQMARQVAHEVKNPLTPIQLSAQMVRQACEDEHPQLPRIVDENVTRIETQVERLRQIASEFSLLGREELDDVGVVGLAPVLEEVAGAYPPLDGRPRVYCEVDSGLEAVASRTGLLKILSNLVQNGLQASGDAGEVRIRAHGLEDHVEIEVLDDGPGIAPEVADRLFEPYFSTKSTGTGLGLVISRNLAEKMGGRLTLVNREGRDGARARLRLEFSRDTDSGPGPTGSG